MQPPPLRFLSACKQPKVMNPGIHINPYVQPRVEGTVVHHDHVLTNRRTWAIPVLTNGSLLQRGVSSLKSCLMLWVSRLPSQVFKGLGIHSSSSTQRLDHLFQLLIFFLTEKSMAEVYNCMQMYYTIILRVFWKWSTIFTLDIEMWSTGGGGCTLGSCLWGLVFIRQRMHRKFRPSTKLVKTSRQELSHQLFLDSTLHDIWGFTQLHRTADMIHLTKHTEFNSLIYMSRIATPGDSRWQLPCFWSSVAFSNSRQPLMYSWRILCSQDSSLPCLHISKWTRFLHSLMKLEIKHKSWWSCWNRLTGLKSQIVTNKLCKVSFSKTILSV